MIKRLENDLQRRKFEMYQFYYQSIGISIKQRRLELKMTQEALAKGICSNTYISKIENNAIAVNRESLYLIMERMDMPIEAIGFPEEMVEILESSFDMFVKKDFEGYERLFQNISKYQFGILIQIARFGYYVLIGDTDAARVHYNELFRYLSSLKEYGLSVFALYACWYNIQINEYQKAKEILERIENLHHYNEDINALLFELQFVIYGHLNLFSIARSGFEIASTLFIQKKNLARIVELIVYQNIYNIFSRSLASIDFHVDQIKYLSGKQKNQYLWMIAHAIECPEGLEEYFDLKEPHYLDYLYQLATSYRSREMNEEYQETKKKLAMLHYELHAPVDYSQILELSETNDELEYKDFLASLLLPYYYSIENIYLAGMVTEEISELLKKHSRYKDSGIYRERYQKFVEKLQKTKRAK